MMTPKLKKISALILLLTFPFTQTGWSADAIQMIDGQPQAVADPFAAQTTTQASAEPIDFLSETLPLSLPEEPALLPARLSLSSTAGLTSAHVTTLAGAPRIYLASGSTSVTTVQNPATNIVRMNYQASSVADFSGFMVSFDNASTANIETVSWSALTQVTLGLKGNASVVRLQIEDMNGNKDEIDLNGVSATTEKFWRIQTASLSGSIDKSKIKLLRFLVSPANGAAAGSGFVDLRLGGMNLSAPAVPVVAAVPAFTNQSILTLSGTKEAQTAILINGVEVVGRNELTTWSVQVPLLIEGANAFSVTAKNMLGKLSAVKSVSVTKDTMMPAGTININSGALYAASRTVTLNLFATDNKSGVGTMSFSTDGRNWSAPEAYKTSKSFVLPEGDGAKTVYVKYFDKAENQSMAYFKSIVLDLLPPSGTVTVGNGSGFINSRTATLYLNALDAGSGLSKMSFSANGTTWTTAENYASQKSWAFPAGDGAKKVYVKFQDKSGKWSAPILVNTVLDTVKPVGALNINSGDTYARSNSVTLNLSASDVGGGVGSMSFSTDNVNWTSPEAFATSKTFELPSGDGSKTVFVKYFDKAGNASAVYSKAITLDASAPVGSLTINQGNSYVDQSAVTLNLSAQDAGSGVSQMQFSNDGLNWSVAEVFSTVKNWVLAAGEGLKTVFVKFMDAMGNWSQAISSQIFMDASAPMGSVSINGGATHTNSKDLTLRFIANDSGSGVSKMLFSANWINWTSIEDFVSEKVMTLPDGDGTKTVSVTYIDKSGKSSAAYTHSIILDTTAPAITVASQVPALTNNPNLTVNYTVDGTAKQKSFVLSEGINNLSIVEVDAAGNSTTLNLPAVNLDTVAPTILVTSAIPALTKKSNLIVDYTVDGVAKQKSFSLVEGINNLSVIETDLAGNLTKLNLLPVTLDAVAPAIVVTSQVPELTNSPNLTVSYTVDGVVKQKPFVLVEGSNSLSLVEMDAAGNSTTLNLSPVTLDTIAPAIVITSQVPALTNISNLTLNYTADGVVKQKSFPVVEGINNLSITETDLAGNTTVFNLPQVTLDTIAPTGTMHLVGTISDNFFYGFPQKLSLSSSDALSGLAQMRFSLNGGVSWTQWEAYAAQRNITWQESTMLYDYLNTNTIRFVVEYKDNAGNIGRATMTSVQDAEFPQGTISINGGAAFTKNREVNLALTAADSISGVRGIHILVHDESGSGTYHYDSGLIPYEPLKTIELPLGDGLKTIQYGVCDWVSCVYQSASIVLDTTAPAIAVTSVMPSLTNNPNLTVSYTVDGAAKQKSFLLAEGSNSLRIVEIDAAGNSTSFNLSPVTLDTITPQGTVLVNNGNAYANGQGVALRLDALDSGSGVTQMSFSNDGVNWSVAEVFSTVKSWVLAAGEGLKNVFVKFMDAVGNWSQAILSQIFMDTAAPVGLVSINSGAVYTKSQDVTLSFVANDSGSGVEKMSLSTDGVNWGALENFASEKTFTLSSGDGTKTVYVRYYDKSGKPSDVYTHSIVLDTTAPSISTVGSIPSLTNNSNLLVTYAADGIQKQKSFVLSEGINNLSIIETDAAGNSTTLNLSPVTLDTNGPSIYVSLSLSPSLINNAEYNLFVVVDGVIQSRRYILQEGQNVLDFEAVDTLGNISRLTHGVTLDSVPPVAPTIVSYDGYPIQPGERVFPHLGYEDFQFEGLTDSGSGLDGKARYSIDSGVTWSGWASYFGGSPNGTILVNLGQPPAGLADLHFQFRDKAGNIATTILPVGFDYNLPTGSIQVQGGVTATNRRDIILNLTAETGLAGISHIAVAESVGGLWSPSNQHAFSPNLPVALSEGDGTKTIYYRVYKNGSHFTESQIYQVVITLDTIAPLIVITSQVPALTNNSTLVVDYTFDGTVKQKSFNLVEGVNNLSIIETDSAGNQSSRPIQVEYQTSWDLNIVGGGLQHFDNGVLQYQINADDSRIDFALNGAITQYSFGSEQANAKVLLLDDAQNNLEIRNVSGQLLKTVSGLKPTAPNLTNALKVNLQNGIEAYYLNGTLKEIRTATGIRLFDLILSSPTAEGEKPEILDAVISYPNGFFEILWNKQLVRKISPEGAITDMLPGGKIGREVSEAVEQTYVDVYSSQGVPAGTKIISNLGDVITYDEKGILREARGHDGKQFLYDRTISGDSFVVHLNTALSSVPLARTLKSGQYTQAGEVVELEFQDGSQITFENGRVKTAVDAEGNAIDYAPLLLNGVQAGLSVNRGDTSFQYDTTGFLSRIETGSGTVVRTQNDSNGDGVVDDQDTVDLLLELADGNILKDFELDPDGKILNGIIKTREGVQQKIENGVLKELLTTDGKKYLINAGQATLDSWTFQDGLVVKYGGVGIQQILFPSGKKIDQIQMSAQKEIQSYVETDSDGVQSYYKNNVLEKRVIAGVTFFYSRDGRVQKIIRNGLEERVLHQFDANGNWIGLKLASEDGTLTYDAEGKLTELLTSGLRAEVESDYIARISTRFGDLDQPTFNASGNVSGEIVLSDERKLLVQDGRLARITFKNGTQIDYTNGRISRIENSEGIYDLIYVETSGKLEDVKLNWTLKNSALATEVVTDTLPIVLLGNSQLASNTGKFGNYFSLDGSGDFLTVSDHPDFNLGTGNFTVDFQVKWDDTTSYSRLFEIGSYYGVGKGLSVQWYPNAMQICYNGGNCSDIPFQHEAGRWYHLAFVREGDAINFYSDGKRVGSVPLTPGTAIQTAGTGLRMGVWNYYPNSYNLKGALDEFRLSTTARWSADFAPPEEEHAVDASTLFLHHFNNVANYYTKRELEPFIPAQSLMAVGGNTAVSTADPSLGNASVLFDGNDDYLSVEDAPQLNLGGNDFTIELNVRFDSLSQGHNSLVGQWVGTSAFGKAWYFSYNDADKKLYFLYSVDGGANKFFSVDWDAVTTKVWYHMAVVRSGSELRFFVDGRQQGEAQSIAADVINDSAANLHIGTLKNSDGAYLYDLLGAVDEMRISNVARWAGEFDKPVAQYAVDRNTLFLNHFDSLTSYETAVQLQAVPITIQGNTIAVGGNAVFDGLGDDLSIPSSNFDFGSGDFTLETKVKFDTVNQQHTLVADYNSGGWIWLVDPASRQVYLYNSGQSRVTFNTGVWEANRSYELSIARQGNQIRFFRDGVMEGGVQTPAADYVGDPNRALTIGSYANQTYLKGAMDWIRISKGIGRYSQNYSSSAQSFIPDAHTLLLHDFDLLSSAQSVPTPSVISTGGDAKTYAPQAVFDDAMHFDGVGDELKIYDNTLLNFGAGDFTIDFRANFEQAKNGERYTFVARGDSAEFRLIRETNNKVRFELMGSTYDFDTFMPGANRWYHLALVRKNGQLRFYVDGVAHTAVYSSSQNVALPASTPVTLGAWYVNNNNPFLGMLDEFRISDIARWSTNFSVPAVEYETDKNTRFLHHMDDLQPASSATETIKTGNTHVEFVKTTTPVVSQGNIQATAESFKFGKYLSLDGNGDYLSLPTSSEWDLGAKDFTVDFWVNPKGLSGDSSFVSLGTVQNGLSVGLYGNEMLVYFSSTQYFNLGVVTRFDEWQHVALVRSGNYLKVFVNGRQVGQDLNITGRTINNPASGLMLGYRAGHNVWMNGAMDEVRFSDGARWTANFTPPTQEYTIDSNTMFLHHFDDVKRWESHRDLNIPIPQNLSVAKNGNVALATAASNFGGYAVFDGSADYIELSDNAAWNVSDGDFTVEMNFKTDAIGSTQFLALWDYQNGSNYNGFQISPDGKIYGFFRSGWGDVISLQSLAPVQAGQWYHLAISREGNVFRLFLNGILQATDVYAGGAIADSANPLRLGTCRFESYVHDFRGSMDEFRLSKGIARYKADFTPSTEAFALDRYTILLNHFDNLSQIQHVPSTEIISFGNATTFSPDGAFNEALRFDGVNDALKVYGGEALNFGQKDFTIDFRLKFESIQNGQFQTFLSRNNASDIRISRNGSNQLEVYLEGTQYLFGEFKPATNQWYHLGVTRENGQLRMYVDGVARSEVYMSTENMQGTASMNLGVIYNSDYFRGLMDEFRVSDVARWNTNFMVPTQAYSVDQNTRFLHHMDDFGRAESGHEIKKYGIVDAGETFQGAVTQLAGNAKFGTAGLGFSAASQTFMKVPEINFGGSDYTAEGWFQATTANLSGAGLFGQQNQSVTDYAGLYVDWNGKLTYEIRKNSQNLITLTVNQSINYSQKHHFAVAKDGNTVRIFVNGVISAQGMVSDAAMPDFDGVDFTLGKYSFAGYTNFYGWTGSVDEFRISDRARYSANFAVATQAFDVDKNTLFLHHGEGQGLKAGDDFKQPAGEMSLSRYLLENPDSEFAKIISSRPVDNIFSDGASYLLHGSLLSREMSIQGDVKVSSDGEKFEFDGVGDGLKLDGANLDFGADDFTLEAKVRFDSLTTSHTIVSDYTSGGEGWIWHVEPQSNRIAFYPDGWHPVYFSMPPMQVGVFYEMAIVRKGNQIMFFRDGVMQGGIQTPWPTYVGGVSAPIQIGYYGVSDSYLKGSIDRVRITTGVGRYTANYTVPPAYTRDANTAVLLNFTASEFNQKHEIATASGATPTLGRVDLANWVEDVSRGDVLDVSGYVDPRIDGIYQAGTIYTYGYLQSQYSYEVVSGLYDMDGDGDLDRTMLDASEQFWWVQKLEGGVYSAPEKWVGIRNIDTTNLASYPYALRNYYAGYPIVMQDLVDVNGDGRPDRVLSQVGSNFPQWQVQINNGHGFDAIETWDGIQSLSYAALPQTSYAVRVRDSINEPYSQPLIADLVDLDGDGIPDRITQAAASPIPGANLYDHWIFQKGNGHGFEPATVWSGVDHTFNSSAKIAGSMDWFIRDGSVNAEVGRLEDLNGDKLPDRILLKPKMGNPANGYDWYWQKNNGHGFDAAVLWDNSIRQMLGVSLSVATSIQAFDSSANDRSYSVFFKDVTGDGLPDRVTVNMLAGTTAQNIWWVEENDGATFKDAVIWSGIEGGNMSQSSPGQEWNSAQSEKQISGLFDVNGDKIVDRVYYDGSNSWKVQYGTGSGFLPSKTMTIGSVHAEALTEKYDYVHVSLRSDDVILSAKGKVTVKLLDQNGALVQSWDIINPGTQWKDHYLALDTSKATGRYLELAWQYDVGVNAIAPQILVEDIGLTAFRPNAETEWLDYLLTEANVLDAVHGAVSDPAIRDLARVINTQNEFDWRKLLAAETKINFNASGTVSGTEKLNGEVSQVQTSGGTTTVTVVHTDGSVTQAVIPVAGSLNSFTQTIHYDNGTPANLTDDYTEIATITYDRVRSVTRDHQHKQPLQYSYEFDEFSREITVVYDPDTKETQKSRPVSGLDGAENKIVAQIAANGVETRYTYNDRAELIRTEIIYKGRVRETFEQSIAVDGLHNLKTESGSTEFYNDQGQIVGHLTADGYYYKHEFALAKKVVTTTTTQTVVLCDSAKHDCSAIPVAERTLTVSVPTVTLIDCTTNCEQIHQVTLEKFTDADGNSASYTGSQLSGLELATGLKMTFDGTITEEGKDANGNDIETTRPKNVVIFHQDGTVTEFKNGLPYSVTSAAGHIISIEPDLAASTAGRLILKNPSSAAEFHYAEALKLWGQQVLGDFNKFSLSNGVTVQSEYTQNGSKLVTRLFSEGARELYNAQGKIEMVVSEEGERTILYDYDAEGNPIALHLEKSRRSLEQAILELKVEVALKRYEAILQVGEREQVLNETVEGEYIIQRNQLLALRAQVESQRNQLSSMKVKGKGAKSAIANAMNQINGGLSQINQAIYQLAENRSNILESISAQVRDVSQQIEDQSLGAYLDIEKKQKEVQNSILEQELSPIVYHWYRKILGRDASEAEYEAAKGFANYTAGTFNLTALKSQLQNSPELVQRTAEVTAIKSAVRTQLLAYLAMDIAGRQTFAVSLGINTQNVVPLSSDEVNAIMSWLDSQSLHFGQSAFIALEALLNDASISHNRINLARDLILIDIVTGTITPIEKGDLVISMYALNSYAKRYGLNLQPMKLTFDALKALVQEACPTVAPTCNQRIIAHIDGNHFIILTGYFVRVENGVTIEELHYTDPGAGPENALDQITITREEFLNTWGVEKLQVSEGGQSILKQIGYVLSPRAPPATVSAEAQVLSIDQQMKIRGAFFGFLKKIFSRIFDIVLWVIAPVLQILALVSQSMRAFLDTLKQIFLLNFDIIGNLVTFRFSEAFKAFKEQFKLGLSALSQALVLPFTVLGDILVKLGVPEKVAATITAGGKIVAGVALVAVGFVASPFSGGASLLLVGQGLSLIGQGAGEILQLHTNLSPSAIQLITIGIQAVGLVIGAGIGAPGGGINWQAGLSFLKDQAPKLASEFASAGFVALGNHLGWDPRLTGLISIPVSAVAGGLAGGLFKDNFVVGIDPLTGAKIVVPNTRGVLDYVGGALKSSLPQTISLGASMLGLGNGFTAGAITGAVSQLIGNPDLLKNTANLVGNLLLHPGAVIGATAESISNLFTKMNDKITEKGFVGAVSDWVGQMFDRKTQEEIYSAGGVGNVLSVGGVNTTFNNQAAKEYGFGNGSSIFTDLLGNMIGKTENGVTQSGTFGLNSAGKFGLITGKIFANMLGGFAFAGTVDSGALVSGEMVQDNQTILQFSGQGPEGQRWVGFQLPKDVPQEQNNFNWANLALNLVQLGMSFTFNSGNLDRVNVNQLRFDELVDGESVADSMHDDLYVFVNGVGNQKVNSQPDYLDNYGLDVVNKSNERVGHEDVVLAPTFFRNVILDLIGGVNDVSDLLNPTKLAATIAKSPAGFLFNRLLGTATADAAQIMLDLFAIAAENVDVNSPSFLRTDIERSIESYFAIVGDEHRARKMIAMGYSGGFLPLAEALMNNVFSDENPLGYKASSLIGLGAAQFEFDKLVQEILDGVNWANDLLQRISEIPGNIAETFWNFVNKMLQKAASSGLVFFESHLLPAIGNLNEMRVFLKSKAMELIRGLYNDKVEPVKPIDLTTTDLGLMVNIYGTKDLLVEGVMFDGLKIGGERDDIGKFKVTGDPDHPLVNIEIKGATHFDYMRREEQDYSFLTSLMVDGPGTAFSEVGARLVDWVVDFFRNDNDADRQWNLTVSDFVARLTSRAQDKDTLEAFLVEQGLQIAKPSLDGKKWIITLPGHLNYV